MEQEKKVQFVDESYDSTSEESFCETTTSEAERFCTSDEEDAERLDWVLEGAYCRSPAKDISRGSQTTSGERFSSFVR